MSNRQTILDNMLYAVDNFENPMRKETPTTNLTREFWEALAAFGPEFLTGSFDMNVADDGTIDLHFHPNW